MKKKEFFRKNYPKFVYQSYFYKLNKNNLEIFFDFKIEPDINFKPKVVIKKINKSRFQKINKNILDNLIFHLGLIELLSYWKATCSPEIEIRAGFLNKDQICWWKNLILKGMGQFFYENKINFLAPNFLKINVTRNDLVIFQSNLKNRILVPIGGGKDSIVTLEILKAAKKEINCFALNPTSITKKIMKIAGCKESIFVKRKIDPKLFKLNQKGFLNGHTPFSAYLSFLSVLVAFLFDYKYIAFSNERSSNEGNLKYLGRVINHQYSKSFDFEKKFRYYSKKYLLKNIEYFSFLRPLYEIQIAKLFSKYPQYFLVFLSCNEAFKTASGTKKPIKKWCCNCPKCLFVFAILYPFLKESQLIKIFNQNLFQKKNLLPIMQALIGEKKFKPFECVGTKKESQVAFYLSWKKCRGLTPANLPYLLKYFERKILPKYPSLEKQSKRILKSWSNQHNLPKKFIPFLFNYQNQNETERIKK